MEENYIDENCVREEQLRLETRPLDSMATLELVKILLGVKPGERSALQRKATTLARRIETDMPFRPCDSDDQIVRAIWELASRFAGKKSSIYLKPRDIWEQLPHIRGEKKEHFIVFYLDTRNQEIKRDVVSIGTLNYNLVHPREVFEPAVKSLAANIIVAHNHPSGCLEPSDEDLSLTKRLSQAGKLLGIELLDHVIVTKEGFMSFKQKGLL